MLNLDLDGIQPFLKNQHSKVIIKKTETKEGEILFQRRFLKMREGIDV